MLKDQGNISHEAEPGVGNQADNKASGTTDGSEKAVRNGHVLELQIEGFAAQVQAAPVNSVLTVLLLVGETAQADACSVLHHLVQQV